MCSTGSLTHEPVDHVVDRLNDPAVAASLVTLLDHVEVLALMAESLDGFVRRGDVIADSIAEGVAELREVDEAGGARELLSRGPELIELTTTAADAAPALRSLVDSDMLRPEVIAVLSLAADALVEGRRRAETGASDPGGIFGLMRALKDPEVQRGLGFVLEVARALGRGMGAG